MDPNHVFQDKDPLCQDLQGLSKLLHAFSLCGGGFVLFSLHTGFTLGSRCSWGSWWTMWSWGTRGSRGTPGTWDASQHCVYNSRVELGVSILLVCRCLQGVEDALGTVWQEARTACWARRAWWTRASHLSRKPAWPWWSQETWRSHWACLSCLALVTFGTWRPCRPRWSHLSWRSSWTCGSSPPGPWMGNRNGIWQEVLVPGWWGALRGWQVIVWTCRLLGCLQQENLGFQRGQPLTHVAKPGTVHTFLLTVASSKSRATPPLQRSHGAVRNPVGRSNESPHEVGTGPRPPATLVDSLDHRLGAVLHLAGHCPCHRVMAPVPATRVAVAGGGGALLRVAVLLQGCCREWVEEAGGQR